MKYFSWIFFLFFIFCTFACGEDDLSVSANQNANTITIINQTFIPSEIIAAAGDVIYFYNSDSTSHRILSESGPGSFNNTGIFDSSVISENDTRFITIPSTAIPGDVFYFYCDLTNRVMTTPDGTITVE